MNPVLLDYTSNSTQFWLVRRRQEAGEDRCYLEEPADAREAAVVITSSQSVHVAVQKFVFNGI